ncbi:glycosyltransferase family 4 protein [Cytophaga aurantiaca]|uniref:glycosyltransferase family 4 protein n=1 Tax=Cytophaga aurantiaca TaxID=29530 RepID=UPI00039C7AC7|nr:glycosyltransferase family 4 protein [Cytophaga aurantiaca]
MKILYIHQYFKTPSEGGAIRSWYIAKGMVDAGHEVVVVTSHNHPDTVVKIIDGITVHYLPVAYDSSFGFFRRSFSFLSFVRQALDASLKISTIDLCYATSTPITVGIVAYLLKRKKSISYIFEVRDLWPEAPIQMGAIKNTMIKNLLYALEKKIYTHADKIIALSPGMKEGIQRICPNKNVVVVPNMSDCSFFQFEEKKPVLEDAFHVKNKFVVSYIGSAGLSNNLIYLADIIQYCTIHTKKNIVFLIQAKGPDLEKIKSNLKNIDSATVQFLPYSNKEGVKQLLNVSDAVYISFDSKPILETNSPNKFFDTLAAGKLVIVNTSGWLREVVEQEEIGFYADPLDPSMFVEKIESYITDKTRLLASQSKARRVAENVYSKEILVKKILSEL